MRCAALVGAKPAKLADPGACFDHPRRETPGEVEQAHDVDLEILREHLRIDVEKAAEGAADGVVDQHGRCSEPGPDAGQGGIELDFIRDVARIRMGASDLRLQRSQSLAVAREHGHAIATRGEAPGDRRAGARAHPGNDCNRRPHHDRYATGCPRRRGCFDRSPIGDRHLAERRRRRPPPRRRRLPVSVLNAGSGGLPARSNRVDDEETEDNCQSRPASHECRTLRGPPIDDRVRTLNADEWRGMPTMRRVFGVRDVTAT